MPSNNHDIEKRLARLEGQLGAIAASLSAIVRHSNAAQEIVQEIEESCERTISKALNRPFHDSYIEGIDSFRNSILGKK